MARQFAPVLTADEERDLSVRIRSGDVAARHRLIEANLRLVIFIARRFRSKSPLDDLVQEGNLGLIRAAEDFDPGMHDCRFSMYAEVWIKAFIHRFLCKDHLIRVPQRTYLMMKRTGRQNEFRATTIEPGCDPVEPSRDNWLSDSMLLDAAIRRLNPIEAWVIRERYGIAVDSVPTGGRCSLHRSQDDLVRDCGLSKYRIQQAERAALDKLAALLEPLISMAS